MKAKFQHLIHVILDIIFIPLCISCGKKLRAGKESARFVCDACFESVEISSGYGCPKCGRRLPEISNPCHPNEGFALAPVSSYHNSALREIIHRFKYQSVRTAIIPIKEFICSYLARTPIPFDGALVIPIPLQKRRELKRGYNQAELIAEVLANHANLTRSGLVRLEIETKNLAKIKKTLPQAETKTAEERAKNIAGSFILRHPERIRGRNIILVDDVYTTGATMREAVRVLKSACAKKIIGLVIAKT